MDLDSFVRDGFVVLRQAFDGATAAACRDLIWSSLAEHGFRRDERDSWTRPCVRIGSPDGEPFAAAATSPPLIAAYDELIGENRWTRQAAVDGSVPVRFPSEDYPGDVGYHIEGNWWDGEEYRTDVRSTGRGLLALFRTCSSRRSSNRLVRSAWAAARSSRA